MKLPPQLIEKIEKMAEEWIEMGYMDPSEPASRLTEALTHIAQRAIELERGRNGGHYLGERVKAYGKEYEIVGLSRMMYDGDCIGEPEWKITKELQKVAVAEIYDHITFQKPAWINKAELTPHEVGQAKENGGTVPKPSPQIHRGGILR